MGRLTKARIAKKLLKTFMQQQAVLVPPCSMLAIKSTEVDCKSMEHLRELLDSRKVDIRVVLVLPESAQIEVVSSSTSPVCPSSSAPSDPLLASVDPSK